MVDAATIGRALAVLMPIAVLAGLLTAGVIVLGWPWLKTYALARPNLRSSHHRPTPQGGGIVIIIATLAIAWGVVAVLPPFAANEIEQFLAVTAAALLLAVVGAIDDLWTLPRAPRLALQLLAVGGVIASLPSGLQLLPVLPWWVERVGLLLGGVWLVNLVNFMDGIDWITVSEVVPVTGAIVAAGVCGAIEQLPSLVAAILLGAIVGFAPFNKPVAKLFLGDVGSLPIGLLLGWLLLRLAGSGYLIAALILPLYYLADATITLARRIARGEPFWEAHRTHFYQQATDNGFTIPEIVNRIFLVNIGLSALALATIAAHRLEVSLAALVFSGLLVAWLLMIFGRKRR